MAKRKKKQTADDDKPIRVCPCGQEFEPRLCIAWQQKFCSAKCRREAYRETHNWYSRLWSSRNREKAKEYARFYSQERDREHYLKLMRRHSQDYRRGKYFLKMLAKLEMIETNIMEKQMSQTIEEIRIEVKQMSTDALKIQLADGIRVTRDRFLRLGVILVELEFRKELVEGDKFLMKLLRKIGKGELLVDVAVRFAGRPYTLASISKFDVRKQAEYLDKSDMEVEKEFRQNHKKSSSPHSKECSQVNTILSAASGTVADVSDMILEIVHSSSDPVAVAERVMPELLRIKSSKPIKTR